MTGEIGTQLYAPQARLVDLESGTVIGATRVATTGAAVPALAPDIISATVTLTNTSVSTMQVTLNNQRFVEGLPLFPPWKYNDFSQNRPRMDPATGTLGLRFGQKVRLDMRYGDGVWVKMIIAQVMDLQFKFPSKAVAQVDLVGEDLLSLLKIKPDSDKPYAGKHEEEIVEEIWNHVITSAEQRPTFTIQPGARASEGRTQPMRNVRRDKSATYLKFIEDMANRLDYEMHLQFKNIDATPDADVGQAASAAISAQSELEFRFEPARSGNPPVGTQQDGLDQAHGTFDYVLRWGRSLLEFNPKFKVFETPTRADAAGTTPGRRARSRQELSESELSGALASELPRTPNYDLDMKDALTARREYFGAAGVSSENNESTPATNLDDARLKRKARAAFMKRAREFLTAESAVIGLPRLRPGVYVDIVGLRPPFDGFYYVTKTVHTLNEHGYRTTFSLRRPGMLPPEKYLDVPPPTEVTP